MLLRGHLSVADTILLTKLHLSIEIYLLKADSSLSRRHFPELMVSNIKRFQVDVITKDGSANFNVKHTIIITEI